MKAGDGREALQVLHGEGQRTVHHAVDHETMLPGIDVRNEGATGRRHVVERGWRDHPHRILKRRRHMKREPEGIGRRPAAVGYAYRGHETGALAVGDQLLVALDDIRMPVSGRCLVFGRSRALLLPRSNHRPTRRRPSGIPFDQVVSNPWVSPSQMRPTRKSLPRSRKYTPISGSNRAQSGVPCSAVARQVDVVVQAFRPAVSGGPEGPHYIRIFTGSEF